MYCTNYHVASTTIRPIRLEDWQLNSNFNEIIMILPCGLMLK
jgi:hypothetical protein